MIHTAIWFVYSLGGQFICLSHDDDCDIPGSYSSDEVYISDDEDEYYVDDVVDGRDNMAHDNGGHHTPAEANDQRTVRADEEAQVSPGGSE